MDLLNHMLRYNRTLLQERLQLFNPFSCLSLGRIQNLPDLFVCLTEHHAKEFGLHGKGLNNTVKIMDHTAEQSADNSILGLQLIRLFPFIQNSGLIFHTTKFLS